MNTEGTLVLIYKERPGLENNSNNIQEVGNSNTWKKTMSKLK